MWAALCLSSTPLTSTFVFQEYWQDSFCKTLHFDYIKCLQKFLTTGVYKFISHCSLVIWIVMRVLHRALKLDTADLETKKMLFHFPSSLFHTFFFFPRKLSINFYLMKSNVAILNFIYCKNTENQKRWHSCKYFHFPPNSEKHLQSRKVLCLSFVETGRKKGWTWDKFKPLWFPWFQHTVAGLSRVSNRRDSSHLGTNFFVK